MKHEVRAFSEQKLGFYKVFVGTRNLFDSIYYCVFLAACFRVLVFVLRLVVCVLIVFCASAPLCKSNVKRRTVTRFNDHKQKLNNEELPFEAWLNLYIILNFCKTSVLIKHLDLEMPPACTTLLFKALPTSTQCVPIFLVGRQLQLINKKTFLRTLQNLPTCFHGRLKSIASIHGQRHYKNMSTITQTILMV